jgi:hypothetical protein
MVMLTPCVLSVEDAAGMMPTLRNSMPDLPYLCRKWPQRQRQKSKNGKKNGGPQAAVVFADISSP